MNCQKKNNKNPANDQEENCELLVKDLIKTHMDIDSDKITDRSKRPRATVAKFHSYKDRETELRQKSYEPEVKTRLQQTKLFVGIQQLQQTREAMHAFYDDIKTEEMKKNSARQVGNTLFVNDQLFKMYKLFVNGQLFKMFIGGKVVDPPQYMQFHLLLLSNVK